MLRQRYPTKYTKSIIIPDGGAGQPSVAAVNNLAIILIHAINLRELVLQGTLAITAMSIMSQTCTSSLRHLDLVLNDIDAVSALTYLSLFRALRTLHIYIETDPEENRTSMMKDAPPWPMLHLQSLTLFSERASSSNLIVFLCNCDFPRLEELNLDVGVENSGVARRLFDFLSGISLQYLHLKISVSEQLYAIVVPRIRAQALRLKYVYASLPDHLPCDVKTLCINTPKKMEDYRPIWALLNALSKGTTKLKGIRLTMGYKSFHWIDIWPQLNSEEQRKDDHIRVTLFRYAIILSKALVCEISTATR
jgi:hypothetical protein